MVKELDIVALTHGIPEHSLKKGDLGTVVHCYRNPKASEGETFEVEFVNEEGVTTAQLTLKAEDIRVSKTLKSKRRQ